MEQAIQAILGTIVFFAGILLVAVFYLLVLLLWASPFILWICIVVCTIKFTMRLLFK